MDQSINQSSDLRIFEHKIDCSFRFFLSDMDKKFDDSILLGHT